MSRSDVTVAMKLTFLFFLTAAAVRPHSAGAVSYPPVHAQEEITAKRIRMKGETACLFESGTKDVKQAIKTDDVLIVFRGGPGNEIREVGKVRIISYIGDYHMRAVVLEGEVVLGDMARKGETAGLLISDELCR